MRAIFVLSCSLVLALTLYFIFIGSYWYFIPRRPVPVYSYVNGPISSLPVFAELDNEKAGLVECYFDKNDVYMKVNFKGGVGYVFDHHQKYVWGWKLPSAPEWSFPRPYNCWRLVSQFGQ